MAIKVKVCGMKYPDNITAVASLGIDYMGFIFYDQSKRYVGQSSSSYIKDLDSLSKVGVFVNASLSEILDKITEFQLNAIQLHGNESAEFCLELKEKSTVSIVKAFGVDKNFDWIQLDPYAKIVDYFLFDTKSSSYGGTGVQFDWSLLDQYKLTTPYFLSGGLDPENIKTALERNDPRLYALDLNSKFEVEPGLKDIELLSHSINTIKK
ncbi:phosphoribosylanthranilate isomerase [Sphingobacterium siyangense]|uniref:phosphoribosylanthranilate isomerase n=1 Tax=Sphingobacterium siyangense TaxID=459529 RepID=UPI0019657B86|nr:phosphoribosylanthranilate isomerase [Sphingobacterium siyangense]QRY57702.1 phosphoribosylanthranilate isomerase [Sphingobacterium siyangense]